MCLTGKTPGLDKFRSGRPSNRNTEKKVTYWRVDKKVVTRGLQEPNPVFPLGAKGSVFANSECTATSGHITTANNKKRRATMSDRGGNNREK